jgi:hypothetical protein
MTLPNFLVLGAAKAGTSSLEQYLRQHPHIFLNSTWKELRFFAYDGIRPSYAGPGDQEWNRFTVTTLADDEAHFDGASTETALGEVSPVYLYNERAPERIARYVPDARLIAILRNPIERAHSHYVHLLRDGRERADSFEQALSLEDERVRDNWEWSWHYRRAGLYHEQLERYFARFDRARIRLVLYDDFLDDPAGVVQDIFRFLGVDASFVPDMRIRHNVSGLPRSRLVSKSLMNIRTTLKRISTPVKPCIPPSVWRGGAAAIWSLYNANQTKPPLDAATHRALASYFQDDVRRLENLLGRDLSHWLEPRR